MKQAKREYKEALHNFREEGLRTFSDELHANLLSKDMVSFWKSWGCKLGKKPAFAKVVDGCTSSLEIANVFKDFFSRTCVPNNASVHDKHKNDFHNLFNNYHCSIDHNDLFSITDLEIALSKLKKVKLWGRWGLGGTFSACSSMPNYVG